MCSSMVPTVLAYFYPTKHQPISKWRKPNTLCGTKQIFRHTVQKLQSFKRPCHGSGGHSLFFHGLSPWGPSSIPGQPTWNLQWKKWHCHMSKQTNLFFLCQLSVSCHLCIIDISFLTLILSEGQAGGAWKTSNKAKLFWT